MEQVIAVGDGANDLPMLKLAGAGDRLPRETAGAAERASGDFDAGAGRHSIPARCAIARRSDAGGVWLTARRV